MSNRHAVTFSLRQLRYFLAAAHTLSVTQAARSLHISQPSVSTAISSLEKQFDVQLFVRHNAQGLSLTPAGQLLLSRARDLLRHASEVETSLLHFSTEDSGPLDVGFMVTLAPMLLPSLVREFVTRFPDIRLTPSEGDQAQLLSDLREGRLDCAVTYDLALPSEFSFVPLAVLDPLVLLPSGHPLASQPALQLADLAAEPMILLDLPLSREYFLSFFSGAGLQPNIAYRSGFADVVHAMVASGLGYTFWNYPLAGWHALPAGGLLEARLIDALPAIRLGLVSLNAAYPRRVVQTFQAHCQEILQPFMSSEAG